MILSDAYYLTKPAIPLKVRLALRSILAKHLRKRNTGIWPINEAASEAPARWPGWPEGKKFAFVLTHDVEGMKGLDRSRELADLEIEMGFRSAFNFVPEGEYRVPESLREFLTGNGFEVGVHDLHHDGSLYRSRRSFRSGVEKINQYVESWGSLGFRSAFMRHNLSWLGEVNVLYDSSTFDVDPFEPQPDGAGTIFPFWVPQGNEYGYVEIPYTLPQDSTLFLLLKEKTIDIWKRKLDWVAQKGGLALVIVHPDYISFNGKKQLGEYSVQMYRELLEYAANRYGDQCWFTLPKEAAQYFYAEMVAKSGLNRRLIAQEASRQDQKTRIGLSESICKSQPADHLVSQVSEIPLLQGKRMAVVSFSHFPGDPRPRRAAEVFARAGMKVEVICLKEEESPKHGTFEGIEIDRIGIKKIRNSKTWYVFQYCLFILIAFAKLAARSLTRRYHVVHIHNMPDVLVFAALVPKLLGAKVILDLHDPMPELMMTIFNLRRESLGVRLMAWFERWSIARADAVITVNRACERLFVSRGCSASKVSVVMNSPDERIFKYSPARIRHRKSGGVSEPFVIMYHGTLEDRNGVDIAVEALGKVLQFVPAAELRIYGHRTPFLEQVMSTVSDKGLEKAVQYLGPRRLEQLTEAIAECDVGVIPNKRSIFTEINTPTRIFEYLALGKPVVAPRAPGIQDYFSEDSLVFFDLGEAHDLALKLTWVALSQKEALEIANRGQAVYRSHCWQEEKAKLITTVVTLLSSERQFNGISG
jgi:glycosyltransferase involved in cell wall biosynthesis/peptidoglycan/xylan/chitin deacetylase (PgdA/CDA1 family)